MSRFTIVVPVFNEESCLATLLDRLAALNASPGDEYEYLFVDDGSQDQSLSILMEASRKNPAFKVLALSRNFGHQVAITAGLDYASGDAVVIIDADLQDPPELIPQMAAKWHEGYDVVYARRMVRHGEGLLKRLSASLFYRVLGSVAPLNIPRNTGDFRLMSRRAVLALRQLRERHRFMRGLSTWIGFPQTCVEYERDPRASGETKYTLGKMMRLAVDGVVSFSWVPLRLSFYAGLIAIFICGLYVIAALCLWTFTTYVVPGWLSLATLIVFFGSLQLVTLGIMGEYVGRILDEVKARPLYFLRETANVEPQENRADMGATGKAAPTHHKPGAPRQDG
jgi:dolichol-phosphate mannosyltransferase